MKRYPKYKDSGIDWIGRAPSHWATMPIKFMLLDSSAGIWGNDEKGDSNDILCFRAADFDYAKGCVSLEKTVKRNIKPNELLGRDLRPGDLLIEKSGGGEITPVGRIVRFDYNGSATYSNFLHRIRFKVNYNSNYFFYWFYASFKNKETHLFFNQTTGIQNLKLIEYFGRQIPVPPINEQEAIADYLDAKCGEIDRGIEKQRKRIDLFDELKQSIITNAVTRGLNPNVTLRPSGIDWIGEIPEHWEIIKTSIIFNGIGSGTTPSTSKKEYYTENEDGYYWLQTGDLNNGYITSTSKQITEIAKRECGLKFYPKGSLVIAMYGATIGKVGLLKITTCTNQACCVLPHSKIMIPRYAFYAYLSSKQSLLLEASGGGQPNISQDIIRRNRLPVPPIKEQEEIAEYLDAETAKIDAQIQRINREIELLEEYKQSIITEVVTGKRCVCDFADSPIVYEPAEPQYNIAAEP